MCDIYLTESTFSVLFKFEWFPRVDIFIILISNLNVGEIERVYVQLLRKFTVKLQQ